MATDRTYSTDEHLVSPRSTPAWGPVVIGASLLIWPALRNGYPIVFADTGTYLSQAIERYLGWDRPPFYSLFMLPLHLTLSLWPVILVQALLASHTLHLVFRVLLSGPDTGGGDAKAIRPAFSRPAFSRRDSGAIHRAISWATLWASPWMLVPFLALLSALTWLPWVVSEIMPELFTPLLVLTLSLLALAPERLTRSERVWLVGFSAFMVASQQSSVPLAIVLSVCLMLIRSPARATTRQRIAAWA